MLPIMYLFENLFMIIFTIEFGHNLAKEIDLSDTYYMNAHGRQAIFGDLYDAVTDTFTGESVFLSGKFDQKDFQSTDNFAMIDKEDHTFDNSYSEKFSRLKVGGNSRMSILSGSFPLRGSAQLFADRLTNDRSVKAYLCLDYVKQCRQISSLYYPETIQHKINNETVKNTNATHIVIQICYGNRDVITLEPKNLNTNRSKEEYKDLINTAMKSINNFVVKNVREDKVVYDETEKWLKFNYFSDYKSLYDNTKAKSLYEALNYMYEGLRLGPDSRAAIKYGLYGIDFLRKMERFPLRKEPVHNFDLPESDSARFYFEDLNIFEQLMNSYQMVINEMSDYLSDIELAKTREFVTDFYTNWTNFEIKLSDSVINFRKGKTQMAELEKLIDQEKKSLVNIENTIIYHYYQHCLYLKRLRTRVNIISKSKNFQDFLLENKSKTLIVGFYDHQCTSAYNDDGIFVDIRNIFGTKEYFGNDVEVYAINYENIRELPEFLKKRSNKRVISLFQNGIVLVEDYKSFYFLAQNFTEILNRIRDDKVPTGFVYTQFPKQKEPSKLWPEYNWKDITNQYSGQFFRAEGGLSKSFGEIQTDDCPHLTAVESALNYEHSISPKRFVRTDSNQYLYVGGDEKWRFGPRIELSFLVSDGEVRPRNQAIRLWKCSGRINNMGDRYNEKLDWSLFEMRRTLEKVSHYPFDYIYAQFPNQNKPQDLNLSLIWKDITDDYSGLFFRAEGGQSKPFGEIQEENSRRLVAIKMSETYDRDHRNVELVPGKWSYVRLGRHREVKDPLSIRVKTMGYEVRPESQGFRIWRVDNYEDSKTHINLPNTAMETLEYLKKYHDHNRVRLGYVYPQLYSQPSASELWPSVKWEDITHQFGGHFFRAIDKENEWSSVSPAMCPMVTELQSGDHFKSSDRPKDQIQISSGQWSPYVVSGTYGGVWVGLRFKSSQSEVRPLNQAIRIWKRI